MCKANKGLLDLLSSPERGLRFRVSETEAAGGGDGWREVCATGTTDEGLFCVVEVSGDAPELEDAARSAGLIAELLEAAFSGGLEALMDGDGGEEVPVDGASASASPRRTLAGELERRGVPEMMVQGFVSLLEQDGALLEDEVDLAADAAVCAWATTSGMGLRMAELSHELVKRFEVSDRRKGLEVVR